MNTKQIQFTRQKAVVFLLAGLILAAIAGLTYIQPTYMGQPWPQPKAVAGSKVGSGTDGVKLMDCDSGLSSWLQLEVVRGSKPGGTTDGLKGCLGEPLPWSPLRFITGRKPGVSAGSGL